MLKINYDMQAMLEKDWRVKDNIIIAMNHFNKVHVMRNETSNNILSFEQMFKISVRYAKKKNIDLVEATKELKEFIRINKNMSKFCLQKEIYNL